MEPIRSALAELAAEMVTTITPALVHLAKETNRDLARFVGEQIAHALENSDQELNA